MFRRINTMKARLSFFSLLIVVVMVAAMLGSEYLLQRQLTKIEVVMIDFEQSPSLADTEVITRAAAQAREQIALKFFWLTIISIALLLVGLTFLYLLIQKELTPLEQLKDDMDQMDFHQKDTALLLPKSKSSEMVSLTQSYNAMIEHLRESYLLQQRFSQNAAHELKTPLTTMKASLQVHQMMKDTAGESEETVELLETLSAQVERMEQLVGGLLQMSARKTLQLEEVQIRTLVEELLSGFGDQIADKQLTVTVTGGMTLQTDRSLMMMLLQNVMENAIRYNRRGGVLRVSMKEDIVIADTGIGIAKEEQERVFSPFYCVDASRSKELGGLGLGLSIVAECADQLGVSLALASELGVGTTVRITPPNQKAILGRC